MVFYDNNKVLRITYNVLKVIVIGLLAVIIAFGAYNYVVKKVLYPLKFQKEITENSLTYSLNPLLVFAVVKTESNFNQNAQSSAGAVGLMQITPKTAGYIASMRKVAHYDLFDPKTNVDFGCFYLKYLIDKFKNLDTALCAYNAGEGNVYSWLTNEKYSTDGQTLEIIPFKETREYINKIKKNFAKYNNYYGYILDK